MAPPLHDKRINPAEQRGHVQTVADAKSVPSPIKLEAVAESIRSIDAQLTKFLQKGKSKSELFFRWLKITGISLSILFAYMQYIARTLETRIDQGERILISVSEQLASSSIPIRATAVRTLYDLAFRDMLVEPVSGWHGPATNFVHWVSDKREYRYLERARSLFSEFAKSERLFTNHKRHAVSTIILKTAIEWKSKEAALLDLNPPGSTHWFLFRAKLDRAYAPSQELEDTVFFDADLRHAVLSSSNLSNAYLEGSSLEGASLESCILQNTNFIGAMMKNSSLRFAKLHNAHLENAVLDGADLTLADATRSSFRDATLRGAVLRTANLQDVNFVGADLRGANFSNANLNGVDFSNADLRMADFRLAEGLEDVSSWNGSQIDGAKFPANFRPPR